MKIKRIYTEQKYKCKTSVFAYLCCTAWGKRWSHQILTGFVNGIWKKLLFWVYRKCFRSLSSAHETWERKCCVYIFVRFKCRIRRTSNALSQQRSCFLPRTYFQMHDSLSFALTPSWQQRVGRTCALPCESLSCLFSSLPPSNHPSMQGKKGTRGSQ